MAEETTIYSVEISASDALKTLADLRLQSQALREEQRSLGKVTEENATEYFRLDNQIKAINGQASKYQKQIQQQIKVQNQQEASLEQLRTQLSIMNAEYVQLGNTQKNLAKRTELGKQIADTTAELKKQEEALGDYRRNVGDYEKAGNSLRQELRELTLQLQEMALAGERGSEAYQDLAKRAADLRTAQSDVNDEISKLSSNTAGFDTVKNSIQGVSAAFTAYVAIYKLYGTQTEKADKVLKNFGITLAAVNALTLIQQNLYKTSNTYRAAANVLQFIGINQTLAENRALAAKNAYLATNNTLTKISTGLTWLWNAALSANPVVILAVAIGGLITAGYALTQMFKENTKAVDENAEAQKRLATSAEDTDRRLTAIAQKRYTEVEAARLQGRLQVAELRKNGASAIQIAQTEYLATKKIRDAEIDALQREQKTRQDNVKALEGQLKSVQDYLTYSTDANINTEELTKTISDLTKALTIARGELDKTNVTLLNIVQDGLDADYNLNKIITDNALQRFETLSTQNQKYLTESFKAENQYTNDSLAQQQAYERKLFDITQNGERERLDARKRYGKLTQQDYKAQIDILEAQRTQFLNKQLNDANNYFETVRNSVLKQAGLTAEQQIAQAITDYEKAIKDLNSVNAPLRLPGMSDEDFNKALDSYAQFLYDRADLEERLQKQLDAQIAEIRESSIAKQLSDIAKTVNKEYDKDLLRYVDNEREKIRIQQESIQKQIEAVKKAGLDTGALENQYRTNELRLLKLNLDKELLEANQSYTKRYKARKKSLEQELELVEGNIDRERELQQQLRDLDMSFWDERLTDLQNYADQVSQIFSSVNSIIGNSLDRRLQKVQSNAKAQELVYAKQYSQGVLNEAEYNEAILKLQQEQEAEEAKIERERAKREKASKIFSIITDTALGISRSVAASPLTFGLPWSAFAAVNGALQLAAVISEPLPKAEDGMLVSGPSHAGGGVNIEAEGGEVIINKNSANAFMPLLSAINQAGGGVPFMSAYSDGGYLARFAQQSNQSTDSISERMQELLQNISVVATIQDIRREEQNYINIKQAGSF